MSMKLHSYVRVAEVEPGAPFVDYVLRFLPRFHCLAPAKQLVPPYALC